MAGFRWDFKEAVTLSMYVKTMFNVSHNILKRMAVNIFFFLSHFQLK